MPRTTKPAAKRKAVKPKQVSGLAAVESVVRKVVTEEFDARHSIGWPSGGMVGSVPYLRPSTEKPLIHQAVMAIMKAILPIAKTHEHPDEGFNFRLIDELTAPLNALMAANQVYIGFRVVEYAEKDRPTMGGQLSIATKVKMEFRLICALDGSATEWDSTMGEAMSPSQFSTNAAQTMALKQFLWMKFIIPVMNSDDPEGQKDFEPQLTTAPVETKTAPSDPATPGLFDEPVYVTQPKATTEATKPEANGKDLSKSSVGILRSLLASHTSIGEADVCERFEVSELGKLKQSQMEDVRQFIEAS